MADPVPDRAADLQMKQERVAAMLRESDLDGLLVLDPINFPWLTAGGVARGIPNPADLPCLYFQGPQRWLLCCNTDTQRLFDDELDGLGFHLKEWSWHAGRVQLLADLFFGRKLACDLSFGESPNVGDRLSAMRRTLTPWAQDRLRDLGKAVAHALEATCRTLERGETEEEAAGQLSHRLIRHNIEPVTISVMANGRGRRYRRGGATQARIERTCVMQTTSRKWGLHVTASRTVSFGPPDDGTRLEQDIACRATAVLIAKCLSNAKLADAVSAADRLFVSVGHEHEWRLAPVGWLTGFAAVESMFVPTDVTTMLEAGQAVVWQGSVGGATNADTVLVTDAGPQIVTPPTGWPVKRIKVGALSLDRPDILVRSE